MLIAETEGRLVGFRAFMRWRFRLGALVRAVRAVDTATHPDFRGKGSSAAHRRPRSMSWDWTRVLIFNTPNDKSLPGYLKMGWQRGRRRCRSASARAATRPLRPAICVPDGARARAMASRWIAVAGPLAAWSRDSRRRGEVEQIWRQHTAR